MLLFSFLIRALRLDTFLIKIAINIFMRNQKDTFYFDDYVVAIMVAVALFILPFLGEFHDFPSNPKLF